MTTDKYLPGLEGDPSGAVLDEWTDDDWGKWFASEVEPSGMWHGFANSEGNFGEILRNHTGGEDPEMLEALRGLMAGLPDFEDHALNSPGLFRRASHENKVKFYRSWHRIRHSLDVESAASGTPDTSLVPVKDRASKMSWKTILVTGVVVVTAGVGVAMVNSDEGSDQTGGPESSVSSSEWSVDDPLGDISSAFDDVGPLDDPDPAADITVMSVNANDGNSSVTIRFAGPARDLSINADQTLNAGLLVVLPDGGTIDILFEDGGCKISDASTAGGTVRCQWLGESDLELKIDGWTPVPGTNLTFATYQASNSALGVSSDTVELVTD